jgi:hypothetical protein
MAKLESKMNKLNRQLKESKEDRVVLHKFAAQNVKEHNVVFQQLENMNALLRSMNHIELNGDGKVYTQEGAFRELYSAIKDLKTITKEIKVKKNFKQAYLDWKQNTAVGKIICTVVGKTILFAVVVFVSLSVVHTLGAESVNPVELTAKIVRALAGLF